MALNDAYRERMGTGDEAADETFVSPVEQRLEELRAGGLVDGSAVQSALADAGLAGAQVREDYGAILFGAMTPSGGCVFGEVSADSVSVEVGGLIQDGGCLAAQ